MTEATICNECKKEPIVCSADLGGYFVCSQCGEEEVCNSAGKKPVTCFTCSKEGFCRWCGKNTIKELNEEKIIEKVLKDFGYLARPRINILFAKKIIQETIKELEKNEK
jgi:hypothetical protein